jgi:hypothetical protein
MTKAEFERAVRLREEPLLCEALYWLVGELYDHIHKKRQPTIDRDDWLQEGVLLCYERLNRHPMPWGFFPEIYDPFPMGAEVKSYEQTNLFRMFTTILAGHFQQITRKPKNYNHLKAKYKSFLKNRTSP